MRSFSAEANPPASGLYIINIGNDWTDEDM